MIGRYNEWRECIDVSSYQGNIDWKKVKAAGIEGAILRSYTSKGLDVKFREYLQGCRENGIKTGIYLYSYAKSVSGAMADAERMLDLGGRHELGLWYDMEWAEQRKLGSRITEMACAFQEYITSVKVTGGIYCNKDWFKNYFKNYPLTIWLADYHNTIVSVEAESAKNEVVGHQYTSKGKVPGIIGNVDRDRMHPDFFIEKGKERCPYEEPVRDFNIVNHTEWESLWLKWHLNRLGYECYPTRVFGEVTDQQLRHFQHSIGISFEDDGTVDKKTRKALIEKVEEK